jgi:thymidylate synthase (FAD)
MIAEFKLLDHGYLRLVESWGSDESVVEAARMSTGKGFLGWGTESCGWCGLQKTDHGNDGSCPDTSSQFYTTHVKKPGDEKLLRYLYEHHHSTPFEMAGLIVEVQAPIFVFREWHRHRTQSYNEMSARYTPLPDVNYIPSVERLMINAGGTNKQAGTIAGAEQMTEDTARWFRGCLEQEYEEAENLYQTALRKGVPKELARVHLPVGRYSRMRASANLRNWLAFMTLRSAQDAQWEIRQYSDAIGEIVAQVFPRTWELFSERKDR